MMNFALKMMNFALENDERLGTLDIFEIKEVLLGLGKSLTDEEVEMVRFYKHRYDDDDDDDDNDDDDDDELGPRDFSRMGANSS